MAGEVDNIILWQSQDIRAMLDQQGKTLNRHTDQLEALRKDIHDWQETIATTSGFAIHANLRNQQLESRIDDLTRRVAALESAR